jgi:hypothetical protein
MVTKFEHKRVAVSVVVVCLLLCCAASLSFAEADLTGKKHKVRGVECTIYEGKLVSHSPNGLTVILDDKSRYNANFAPNMTVVDGVAHKGIKKDDVWGKSKRVRLYVSDDSNIQNIAVLVWK